MKKIKTLLTIITLTITILTLLIINNQEREKIMINNVTVSVKIADEPSEWSEGLMFVKKLDKNEGMLFEYPNEDYRSFWMKNTLIPLDLIFVGEDLRVVDVKQGFEPCEQDPCPVYTSKKPAKYVLEVNAGFVEENNVTIGSILKKFYWCNISSSNSCK